MRQISENFNFFLLNNLVFSASLLKIPIDKHQTQAKNDEYKEKMLDFIEVLMNLAVENVMEIAEDALFPEDSTDNFDLTNLPVKRVA